MCARSREGGKVRYSTREVRESAPLKYSVDGALSGCGKRRSQELLVNLKSIHDFRAFRLSRPQAHRHIILF